MKPLIFLNKQPYGLLSQFVHLRASPRFAASIPTKFE